MIDMETESYRQLKNRRRMTKDKMITVTQAYEAMIHFLEAYYSRGASDEIAILLGDISINNSDGLPMDPAALSDWYDAVDKVLGEENPDVFKEVEP